MIFGVPVYGGAKLDQAEHYEFTLHDSSLSYDIPAGAWGRPGEFKRVVNYRQYPEKIETWITGRQFFRLTSAVWNYYYKFPLYRLFPVDEIGNFTYRISLDKLPSGLQGESSTDRLENYIWKFLEEYLEGPEGINTETRGRNSGISEKNLPEGYWESLIVPMPGKLQFINLTKEWRYFELAGKNFHKETHYFYTSLNDEFALSIEFQPYCNRSPKSRAGKYVNDMHEKTMQMIMNSIRLDIG
jgi:hypothetical protein